MILRNAIKTPDGTILESTHVHDFKIYQDKITGKEYGVDGGLAYLRTIGDMADCTNLSIESDDHKTIRTHLKWGTYGKSGKNPLKFVPLSELSNNHIKAIIATQTLSKEVLSALNDELAYRNSHNINITD